MKTRTFSVLGLLALCAVFSTWGSKAWAVPCTGGGAGGTCLLGSYSCTGAGIWGDADDPTTREDTFSSSGVLNITANTSGGTTILSPGSAGWSLNAGGAPQLQVGVFSGTVAQNGLSGQGQMGLKFGPGGTGPTFEFNGDKALVPEEFNYVINNLVNNIAQEFTLQAIPVSNFDASQEEVVWVMDCRIQ